MRRAGMGVDWVADADAAEAACLAAPFDLVVLDLGLPGRDGLSFLRWLRGAGQAVPVIILTARDAVENRIAGLDLGADDYVTKPFDTEELLARCRAQLRRAHGRAAPLLRHGGIVLDPARQAVTLDGAAVEITGHAYRLLALLLERQGHIVPKADIERALYGWDEGSESNTVEVYVATLRRKLGRDLIRTVRGMGYVIDRP